MSYLIKDYMQKDIATVNIGTSTVEASKLMMKKAVGYLIVMDKGQPVGIVTERDLVWKVMAEEREPLKVCVSEFMSAPLITVDPDATIEDAVRTMAKHKIRKLPVVRNNIIYGIFTTRDLTKHFNKYEDRVTRDIITAQATYGASLDLSLG
jgi:CBS domain-containing protein